MIRAIAIDDEPLALEVISSHASQLDNVSLENTFSNPLDAFSYLSRNEVDLIFLDVQMPEMSGIDFIKTLSKPPKIILTTAYPDYALEGFELSVSDYLLKPIPFDRFVKAVVKVQESIINKVGGEQLQKATVEDDQFIFVNTDYKSLRINFKDIIYIEGWKDYVKIHLENEEVLTLLSIKQLEEILPQSKFIRIHKSFIVAYSAIELVERNQVKVKGVFLNIGGSYKEGFNQWIDKFKVN